MLNFSIKITGSGTAEEIAKSLEKVAKNIRESENLEGGVEWEGPTLMTEIEPE